MIDQIYKNKTKVLTVDYAEEIYNILKTHNSIGKTPYVETLEESVRNSEISSKNPNIRVIGYFEENKLISFLVQRMSEKIPAWHMTLLGTISKHPWNYKLNGLEYCWANAMDYAESKNIFRIYWTLPARWAKTQVKTYKTTDVWYRYNIYIEDIIPPGSKPLWTEHNTSFGEKNRDYESVVKLGVLKNEYRSFNL